MPGDRQGQGTGRTVVDGPVRPGALTALLAELARGPAGPGWDLAAVPGETIGRFEIVREVGRGGFGVVYEARDGELGRSVAFKAVRAKGDAAREQRALAEAEAAARLAHPNIVHLYDVGRCERGPYLILELLRGETLDERIGRGPLPAREAVRVAVEIARGVAHAHSQGVVHRDLKPGNVFVCEDGQVKVLDFGLAHVFGKGGLAGGTPSYMAPEQAAGESGDERSDVYALGVLLHEVLTGRLPFEGKEAGLAGAEKAPELGGVPAALSKLVGRMLARDPAGRPESGAEVLAQLLSVQRALEPKRLLWAAAAVALAAVVGAGLFAWTWQRPLPPGRLLTAIADTDNQTGDPGLDGASRLIATALDQSKRLSLVARSRLAALAEAGEGAKLDAHLTRAAAPRAGAHAMLVPAIRREGEAYRVELRGLRLARGDPLFSFHERADSRESVLDALDRLADRALEELGADAVSGRDRVRLATVFPRDPDAQRWFMEGERLQVSVGAVEAFRRAVEIDPAFGLAHAHLAFVLGVIGDVEGSRRHLDEATRLLDRLPPRDRLLVEALRARRDQRYADSMDRYDRVIREWPEDPIAYWYAGGMLSAALSDCAGAAPYLEKAVELGGLPPGPRVFSLVLLGRLDEAIAVAQRSADPADPASYKHLALAQRARGDPSAALDAARRSVAAGLGLYAFWSFVEADAVDELERTAVREGGRPDAGLLALTGRRRAALAAFDAEAPPPDASPEARGRFHAERLWLVAGDGDGDPEHAWRETEAMFRYGSRRVAFGAYVLTWLGDVPRGTRIAELWAERDPRSPELRSQRILAARWRGELEDAARGFAAAWCLNSPEAAHHLGETLQRLGRDAEAVEAFRKFRRLPDCVGYGSMHAVLLYPRALLLEAVSLERLGRRDEALATVRRLLRLWRRADPELRTLREARALERRLTPGR